MNLKLTEDDAQECVHKFSILVAEPDLQGDYRITQAQADSLYGSIPKRGGVWSVPAWAEEVVRGELADHAEVLRGCADGAFHGGEVGQSLRIHKQAKKFEGMSK